MPGPTTERGRKTAERILVAAEQLLATRSPNSVTVRDIADKAGVTHALVHNYFGGKDDLLRQVMQRAEPRFQAIADSSSDIADCVSEQLKLTYSDRAYIVAVTRAIMDDVPYEEVSRELDTQRAMIACTERTIASGRVPAPAPRGMDPRITVAAATALAMGWQATSRWVVETSDLADADPTWVREEVERIVRAIAEFALPGDTPDT